jgi:hypothetical protein
MARIASLPCWGQDPQLDLAFLDVEDGICGISLSEDDLPLAQLGPGFSGPDPGQEDLGIERRRLSFDFHESWPSARHSGSAGQALVGLAGDRRKQGMPAGVEPAVSETGIIQ